MGRTVDNKPNWGPHYEIAWYAMDRRVADAQRLKKGMSRRSLGVRAKVVI
jgi:hypothetical protein